MIEYLYAEGKADQLAGLAAELVHLKVDVIVTGGPVGTRAAKEATVTIPIVMAQDNDPVGNGFVASLAHPGGNITGLATLTPEIRGKRLDLLKETVPRLPRLAPTVIGRRPIARSKLRSEVQSVRSVPGAPQQCRNLFDLSQILAWLAKERRDVQEQLEWREQIPDLMAPLLNGKGAYRKPNFIPRLEYTN